MRARPVRSAATACLLLTLAACGGGDDAAGGAEGDPAPGAAAALQVPSDAPSVSADDAAAYDAAMRDMSSAFDAFTADYAVASESRDGAGVVAAAGALRDAVSDFDDVVRSLDLAPVQSLADRLLRYHADVVEMLDEVPRARTAARAIRIMEMLPYQDYVAAYEALARAI
ncbi:hypothetical protein [Nocardioides lijunqiniae]|uniref:hypothetical protein n=1 Tax=Nocardioides lijunqiniae TaxID=2760832 RepID=UPI001878BAA3|nr:hypothetical protein [Nocardioides lijunqiniae]